MKPTPIAIARGLLIAAVLTGCASGPPKNEPVVNAVGAGVTETWSEGANAVAQPTTDAAGAGTEILAAPAQASAKEKRK